MNSILKNWKTTAAGLVAILGAAIDVLNAVAHGTQPNLEADFAAVTAGFGLIFAHDGHPTATIAPVEVAQ